MKLKTEYLFLAIILIISFGLDIYGLNWGLPSRWNVDQSLTPALNMLKDKTFFPKIYLQPSLYYYFLLLFLAPYFLYQYIFYPDFGSFLSAAKVSWNYMAIIHPDLAIGIFITTRLSSVIFSLLTVFLVYRIGKIIHSSKAGLFSALILALTMDFVNWAHIEKSISLVNLLTLLSFYYVFLVFKGEDVRKNYLLCCLFGGLAFSVKFNGGITFLLIPIVAFRQYFKKWSIGLKTLFSGAAVYIFSFLLTSPNILFAINRYYTDSIVMRKGVLIPTSLGVILKIWLPNIFGILGTLIQMFGIPLALLIGCGLLYVLFKHFRQSLAIRIMVLFTAIIISFFAMSPRIYRSSNSKFIIQIVPFLAILGGIFLDDFFNGKFLPRCKKIFKCIGLAAIFGTAFFYCLSLDRIFAYDDLRYHATKWVKFNIPLKSNIIVNSPLEHSLGVEVLRDYNVYILGGEPGTKGAYSFIDGKYYGIDNDKLQQIKNLNSSYVIRSLWRSNQPNIYSSLDRLPGQFKLIKSFERKQLWYWSPDMGGYEPMRVEIYIRNIKE